MPDGGKEIMKTEMSLEHNDNDKFLTKEEAKQALSRMIDESESPWLKQISNRPHPENPVFVEYYEYEDGMGGEFKYTPFDDDIEFIGNWACNFKDGWFQSMTSTSHRFDVISGIFTQDENCEWIATITSWTGGHGNSLSQ